MRVRYDRRIGIACIAAATILGALAVASEQISFVGAMTPVAFVGFGVAFLVRPYLLVDERALAVQALIGSARETYRLEPSDLIEFDGNRAFLIHGSQRRAIGVVWWMANRRDWAAFRAWSQRRSAGTPSAGAERGI